MDRLVAHLGTLLDAVATDPDRHLSQVRVVPAGERARVVSWSVGSRGLVAGGFVPDVVSARAAGMPAAVAVADGQRQLSYAELERRANQLAHGLRGRGVGPEAVIAVLLPRGVDLVVALLAVLKVGGVYLPLDPSHPASRIASLVRDSHARLLVTGGAIAVELPVDTPRLLVDDPDTQAGLLTQPEIPPAVDRHRLQAAYLIYTSGSTGRPKAVTVTHGGLANLVAWHHATFGPTAQDRVALTASPGFDASLWEICPALAAGASLHIVPPATVASPSDLRDWLINQQITHSFVATPIAQAVLALPWPADNPLRHLLTGGATLHPIPADRLPFHLTNNYGLTETTVVATSCPITTSGHPVPIGTPLPHTSTYLLDPTTLTLTPPGIPGELFIGGIGLARGYARQPALTAARFIPNPLAGDGSRLYRTGDLARWLPDGHLEFLGRTDTQVNLHGHRVEPAEIETTLRTHPDITATHVTTHTTPTGDTRLVAYLVPANPNHPPTTTDLRHHLATQLPDHMIPAAFTVLPELPLTPTGKIDRDALPTPDTHRPHLDTGYTPPTTPTEQLLTEVWQHVLRIDQIGVHDNFFDLGGHSLLAVQITARIRARLSIDLPLAALFDTPTVAGLAGVVDHLSGAAPTPPIEVVDRDEPLMLSFAQQRLWFLHQLDPDSPEYHVSATLHLDGPLNVAALNRAVTDLVARHEILRTTIQADPDGIPAQTIHPADPVGLPIDNLSDVPPDRAQAEARRLVDAAAARPFNLATEPPLRARLIRLNAGEHVLVLVLHHLATDLRSRQILHRELITLYTAHHSGRSASLPPLPIQYADYAAWQHRQLAGDLLDRQLDYWRTQLADLPTLDLPTDRPRSLVRDPAGAAVSFTIPADVTQRLRTVASQAGASMFMTLLATFQALLARYTGQHDITVGTPIAGRTHPDTEDLIGFFVNTLVLRTNTSGDPTFAELLARVRRTALSAYAHQDLPFEQLVDALQPVRDRSRNPLFQVMLVFGATDADQPARVPLDICGFPTSRTTVQFDLTVNFSELDGGGLRGVIEYATQLFDRSTMDRLATHLCTLLEAIAADPDRHLSRLPLTSPAEHTRLAAWSTGSTSPTVPEQPVHELITTHATSTPTKTAVAAEHDRLTYAELETWANQLAHHLHHTHGIRSDTTVAVLLPRGVELPMALLAILKAGAAYLVLDPDSPTSRLRFQLADSRSRLVISTSALRDRLPPEVVALELDGPATHTRLSGYPHTPPAVRLHPQHAAYVIYTSGSTGTPKATTGTHHNLTQLLTAWTHTHHLAPTHTWLTTANPTFDAFTLDWLRALGPGATLHIGPDRRQLDPTHLAALLTTEPITAFESTPHQLTTLLDHLPATPARLRTVIVTADTWRGDDHRLARTRLPDTQLLTSYGLTETSVDTTTTDTTSRTIAPHRTLPVGRPLPHSQVHVLDPRTLQRAPEGTPGEIFIGGAGLARGYANQPALTAARFVANPFTGAGTRMYRTGDRARWLPDGQVEFLGRTDHQINLRGHRIEPAEIETTLADHPHIATAVVTVHDDPTGNPRLVAYLSTSDNHEPTTTELRTHLGSRLPAHMIPALFIFLPELPLTPTGKINRGALPAPDTQRPNLAAEYRQASTATEQTLASVWQHVLRVDRVGVHDNFFELGGDSILSIQVVTRARAAGVRITPAELFDHPTIATLAAVARRTDPADNADAEPVVGPVGLLPIHRWWAALGSPHPEQFNQATLYTLPTGAADAEVLSRAATAVAEQHDALRLRAHGYPDQLRLAVAADAGGPLVTEHHLTGGSEADQCAELAGIAERAQAGLNLAGGPIWRLELLHRAEGEPAWVLVVVHHLAIDTVSWQILTHDLSLAYHQLHHGQPVDLGPRTTSIRTWARYLDHTEPTPADQDYWTRLAPAGVDPLPIDHTTGPATEAQAATEDLCLTTEHTHALLRTAPAAYRTQINDLLLAALADTIHHWTGAHQVLIDVEGHGRTDTGPHDLTRTLGWFTTLTPALLTVPPDPANAARLITSIKEQLRAIPHHGRLPHGPATRPEVGFTYHGQLDANHELVDREDTRSAWLWRPTPGPTGSATHPDTPLPYLVEITAAVTGGQLHLHLTYPTTRYRPDTIHTLATRLHDTLVGLIEHTTHTPPGAATPSDFPLAELTQSEVDELTTTTPFPIEDTYPLSPMQHGMLFHTLLDPDSGVYFEHTQLTFDGPLDPDTTRQAFQHLVDRHPILRTAIRHDLPTPLQLVAGSATVPFTHHDWTALTTAQQDRQLAELLANDRRRGFDLATPPLLRLTLISHTHTRHTLIISEHHLLLDGWSTPLLINELQTTYQALATGTTPRLPTRRPYRDFIAWLNSQDQQRNQGFWTEQLAGFTTPTPLATESAQPVTGHASHRWQLPDATTQAITEFARTHHLTLNTVLRGALALLIAHHTASTDVCFGAAVAGRPDTLAGAEHMLGLFLNTLPVRTHAQPDSPLLDFLQHLQTQQLAQQPHQHAPLTTIQATSPLPPNTPLFDTLLVYQNFPVTPLVRAGSATSDQLPLCDIGGDAADHYPLTLLVSPGSRLRLTFSYLEAYHRPVTIGRLAEHLTTILESFVDRPERLLGEIDPLTPDERAQLVTWSGQSADSADSESDHLVPDLIHSQALGTPTAVAAVAAGQQVSYAELDDRACRLAGLLRSLGVGAESVVGVCLPSSVDTVVAVLAVFLAGGTYLPLDPATPLTRQAFYLNDAAPVAIVTTEDAADQLPGQSCPLVLLDDADTIAELAAQPATPPATATHPDNAAYLIYTSGSTGTPKAVTITHRALATYTDAITHRLDLRPGHTYALAHPLTVDFPNTLFYPALTHGGSLHLLAPDLVRDPHHLSQYLTTHGIDYLKLTPSHLAALLADADQPTRLLPRSALILGGEPTPITLINHLHTLTADHPTAIHNHYGPTETTIGATTHHSTTPPTTTLPIGTPLPRTTCHVLNPHTLRPTPIGTPGELFIGGPQLARGYHHQPALTAQRFIANPCTDDGSRLYRTGDRARWNAGGQLEFLGRTDHQLKVRGYRIEPAEIETALHSHPQVAAAVVVARNDTTGDARLTAYLTPADHDHPPTNDDLRAHLVTRLPDHMIPSTIVTIDALPRTPSGKIDYRGLPSPVTEHRTVADADPSSPTEHTIAAIWADLLKVTDISAADDFFDLGGHSLLAIQLITRIQARLGVHLAITTVFDNPTLTALAATVDTTLWLQKGSPSAGDADGDQETELL